MIKKGKNEDKEGYDIVFLKDLNWTSRDKKCSKIKTFEMGLTAD